MMFNTKFSVKLILEMLVTIFYKEVIILGDRLNYKCQKISGPERDKVSVQFKI
jgi:hypothetical protein